MAQTKCGKCGEMVDAAKAFCPGCGNSLVEEEQREASRFETMDNTVQLGQTMYNQMLSDMGLSVDKGPSPQEKRVEIIAPVLPNPKAVNTKENVPATSQGSRKTKWIVLAAIIFTAVLFLGLLAAGIILYYFWPRIS